MELANQISDVRKFSRFYTNVIGLLNNHLWNSRFSLPEARVLYELAHSSNNTAKQLIGNLQIDKSYLSRVLKSFEKKKLLRRTRSALDGRAATLALTPLGRKEFNIIDKASANQIGTMLKKITPARRKELVQHMNQIRSILTEYQ